MNIFMLSCKKASGLIDKQSVVGLNMGEKLMLRVHTSMCDACTAYRKQSKIMDDIFHVHFHRTGEENITHLINPDLKEKIISKL